MKNTLIAFLFLIVITLSGCAKIDHDITIAADFSGKGASKVLMPAEGMMSQQEMKKYLEERGITNAIISPIKEDITDDAGKKIPMSGFMVLTAWKTQDELTRYLGAFTPQKNTRPLQINDDGTVLLNLGRNEANSIKIHIDGTIIPESVQGKLISPSDIEFTTGQQITFKYKPSSNKGMLLAIVAGIIIAVGIGIFYMKKNKRFSVAAFVVAFGLVLFIGVNYFNSRPPSIKENASEQSAITKTNEKVSSEPASPAAIRKLSEEDFVLAGIKISTSLPDAETKLGAPIAVSYFEDEHLNKAKIKKSKYEGVIITSLVSNNSNNNSIWSVEINSDKFQTARGIKPGQSANVIVSAYGKPNEIHEFQNEKLNRNCIINSYIMSTQEISFIIDKETNKILEINIGSTL